MGRKCPEMSRLPQVTDEEHSGFFAKHPRDELSRFLATFFPHPIRFRQLWPLGSACQGCTRQGTPATHPRRCAPLDSA